MPGITGRIFASWAASETSYNQRSEKEGALIKGGTSSDVERGSGRLSKEYEDLSSEKIKEMAPSTIDTVGSLSTQEFDKESIQEKTYTRSLENPMLFEPDLHMSTTKAKKMMNQLNECRSSITNPHIGRFLELEEMKNTLEKNVTKLAKNKKMKTFEKKTLARKLTLIIEAHNREVDKLIHKIKEEHATDIPGDPKELKISPINLKI